MKPRPTISRSGTAYQLEGTGSGEMPSLPRIEISLMTSSSRYRLRMNERVGAHCLHTQGPAGPELPPTMPCPSPDRPCRLSYCAQTESGALALRREDMSATLAPARGLPWERPRSFLYSSISRGRMKLRSYLRTQPLSSRMRSASMNSWSTPKRLRYLSYAARLGKLKSANARSPAPSDGRKYP